MCIQWTQVLYSGVITGHSNLPISQFNSLCNECTSGWSMFVYNTPFFCLNLEIGENVINPLQHKLQDH